MSTIDQEQVPSRAPEESADWLARMAAELKSITIGSVDKRRDAYRAAVDIEQASDYATRNGIAFRSMMRKGFEVWVRNMLFLRPEPFIDHLLPETRTRPALEVATEYGLTTQRGIDDKLRYIEQAREARINRCVLHLREGWAEVACVGFVAARDEWKEALRKGAR